MGGTLSAPIKSKSLQRKANRVVRICACSMQGFRLEMEDAHTIEVSLSELHEKSIFVGVYDGHSGNKAAAFLKEELWKRLGQEETLNKETITSVLKNLDQEFLSSSNIYRGHGSTAIFAIISPDFDPEQKISNSSRAEQKYNVKLSWIGDSRGFTQSEGCITEDHKPNMEGEKDRIEAAGGACMQNRVDGKLAVSRAFGDYAFKQNTEKSYEEQKVVGIPDVIEFEVSAGERLLIACDGLTENMHNDQLMEILTSELDKQVDPAYALANLFEECLTSGSQDNMSAILVEFMDGGDYGIDRPKTYIPGPLYRARQDPNFVRAYMKDAAKYGVSDGVELRKTAYEQDIREIRNTTNDSFMISQIEKAIDQLDQDMFQEEISNQADQDGSVGVKKICVDSHLFNLEGSQVVWPTKLLPQKPSHDQKSSALVRKLKMNGKSPMSPSSPNHSSCIERTNLGMVADDEIPKTPASSNHSQGKQTASEEIFLDTKPSSESYDTLLPSAHLAPEPKEISRDTKPSVRSSPPVLPSAHSASDANFIGPPIPHSESNRSSLDIMDSGVTLNYEYGQNTPTKNELIKNHTEVEANLESSIKSLEQEETTRLTKGGDKPLDKEMTQLSPKEHTKTPSKALAQRKRTSQNETNGISLDSQSNHLRNNKVCLKLVPQDISLNNRTKDKVNPKLNVKDDQEDRTLNLKRKRKQDNDVDRKSKKANGLLTG